MLWRLICTWHVLLTWLVNIGALFPLSAQDAVCRILGGNDKATCRAIAERFEEKYDRSLVSALKEELGGVQEI